MSTNPTTAELLARIAELEAANKAKAPKLSMKVTDKGGLSVYGLGRFPVTLYGEQWERLAEVMPTIVAQAKQLPRKSDRVAA